MSCQPSPPPPSPPAKAKVSIGAIHQFDEIEKGAPVRVDLDDGGTLEIEQAYLVISAVELHACEPGRDDYQTPDAGRLLNRLWPLIGGTAHAHVPDSATRLGTPFVEDLLSKPGSARIVGEIAPPLAAYCRAYAIVAPADRDVVNTTALSTDAITGHTLLVRGRYRPEPETDWQSFELTSDAARPVAMRAIDPNTGESPLMLAEPGASAMLLVDKTVRPSIFATRPGAKNAAETILENLTATIKLHQYD